MTATFLSLALLMAALVTAAFSLGLGLGGGIGLGGGLELGGGIGLGGGLELGGGIGLGGGLELGGGIGLGGGLELSLPPLNLGLSVDLLIDVQTVSELLSESYDPLELTDCEIPHHHNMDTSHDRNALLDGERKWGRLNDGSIHVPIAIDPAFTESEVEKIYAGMYDIQNGTCMRLIVYNETALINHSKNYSYVYIRRAVNASELCNSDWIGYWGKGRQNVTIKPKFDNGFDHCMTPGKVAHELLHAIGLDHEHNSPGRCMDVSIEWKNIDETYWSQFDELSPNQYSAYGAPYDYDSIMHYWKDAFSKNGQDTIITRNGATIGQMKGLSYWDRYKLNKMYSCPVVQSPEP